MAPDSAAIRDAIAAAIAITRTPISASDSDFTRNRAPLDSQRAALAFYEGFSRCPSRAATVVGNAPNVLFPAVATAAYDRDLAFLLAGTSLYAISKASPAIPVTAVSASPSATDAIVIMGQRVVWIDPAPSPVSPVSPVLAACTLDSQSATKCKGAQPIYTAPTPAAGDSVEISALAAASGFSGPSPPDRVFWAEWSSHDNVTLLKNCLLDSCQVQNVLAVFRWRVDAM